MQQPTHEIFDQFKQQLPDIDPVETQEWIESQEHQAQALAEMEEAIAVGIGALVDLNGPTHGRNPALLQVWQSSPEASADLLALIRAAAGSGKSQK